jgi:hypothetical protein
MAFWELVIDPPHEFTDLRDADAPPSYSPAFPKVQIEITFSTSHTKVNCGLLSF